METRPSTSRVAAVFGGFEVNPSPRRALRAGVQSLAPRANGPECTDERQVQISG